MQLAKTTTNELLHVSFNQDSGCFAAGTTKGFRICAWRGARGAPAALPRARLSARSGSRGWSGGRRPPPPPRCLDALPHPPSPSRFCARARACCADHCEPFKETFKRDFSAGGLGVVEMLFRCNILALVGGGASPRFAPHKVMIWDDHQNRCIGELAFRSDVRAVRLRRDRVVVALASKVYVYNFADLALLDHLETCDNPRGAWRSGAARGPSHASLPPYPMPAWHGVA